MLIYFGYKYGNPDHVPFFTQAPVPYTNVTFSRKKRIMCVLSRWIYGQEGKWKKKPQT